MRTAMHSLKSLLTILFIFALSPATQAGDYRLFDRGMDGFEHYFEVSCTDPYARGTIVVRYEEKEVEQDTSNASSEYDADGDRPTASAGSGGESPAVVEICLKDRCKSNWTVAKAAESFCK